MKNVLTIALCTSLLALLLTACGREAGTIGNAVQAQGSGQKQILYYRNPMGQSDTSPVPKKDSMGMDYIPVYAQ
ncbi:MAG: hypothetical protein AUJ20_00615 [Comamonadaceae bacterium CG1_02_60_18]|nr:MAG: hypothetical protein AUJ20_00615 [Comamonadaceae bacterium CG1_02_60_18]PIQ52160.1 MAG: hypothetical protein COW02_11495 [Comamonadaceae bacterium CG12_big_fil_rev_8_21_14_0_65_59_15]